MKRSIRDLSPILSMLKDLELAELARLSRQKNLLKTQIENLKLARTEQVGHAEITLFRERDAFSSWTNDEIQRKNLRFAKVSELYEEQRVRSQNALGRDSSYGKLARKR